MTVTTEELQESRRRTTGQGASAELRYLVRGTDDDTAALGQLVVDSPSSHGGLVRKAVSIEPTDNPDLWRGTVKYGLTDTSPPETGESSFSFDTGGGTQHITQSLSTVSSHAAAGTAPDHQGAIGVADGNVAGVDITVPVYNFSETHYLSAATVDDTYKQTLFGLTGKVNNATFKGFSAGEVLFLGASGSRRGTGSDDDWEITFKFAVSENRSGLTVGSITGISKKGWEYLWVQYAEEEDATAKAMVKRPTAAYVEKVYDNGDFSGLGI